MMSSLDFAQRLTRLGTETAYAVSEEAKAHQATGATVYPYHIGDLNFPTPAIFTERTFSNHVSSNELVFIFIPLQIQLSKISLTFMNQNLQRQFLRRRLAIVQQQAFSRSANLSLKVLEGHVEVRLVFDKISPFFGARGSPEVYF